jgi:tRNA (cmo5U34)-methyltransferase
MTQRDTLFASPDAPGAFQFDAQVAAVFPDMIQRSVPGYAQLTALLSLIAERYVQADSRVYDLGCSLGASTLAMAQRSPPCRFIAVDNAEAMVSRCRQSLANVNADVLCADIRDIDIQNASVVILNFTLQFIAPEHRLAMLEKIQRGLRPDGVLVLSEKLAFEQAQTAAELIELHHAFKRANGYSDLEIAQKRTALENVLRPDTLETHHQRLVQAGFARSVTWFQCFNFSSILAWKT